jgi:uncharacterized phage-associated protein
MTFHAADVAAALRDRLPQVPQKKLHKLLYYCQGHHLAAFGTPLFAESISAWDMGPVVGSLWKTEHENGPAGERAELDEAALNTVGYVLSRYGKLTGRDLELLTHAEDPWNRADATRAPKGSVRIEREWLVQYFGAENVDDEDELVLDPGTVSRWLGGATKRRRDQLDEDSYAAVSARLRADAS